MKCFRTKCGGIGACVLLICFAAACSQFDNIVSDSAIPGTYSVETDNKASRSSIIIEQNGKILGLKWSDGSKNFEGTGVNLGQWLGAIFAEEGFDGTCGAIFYKAVGINEMSGTAVVFGKTAYGMERLMRLKGDSFEGEFGISGINPDDGQYQGRLAIVKNKDRYDVTWLIGEKEAGGVGYSWGNVLAVIFGDNRCGVALYRNDRGFFDDTSIVRFKGKIGDVNGFKQEQTINKLSSVTSGSSNN